jgi:hypothetical protein
MEQLRKTKKRLRKEEMKKIELMKEGKWTKCSVFDEPYVPEEVRIPFWFLNTTATRINNIH